MIFVTVGTHEQGMDRLLIELDRLIYNGEIQDGVFAQIGYSKYKPKNYEYKNLIGYDEMDNLVSKSDIVITHGGPGSIFQAIKHKKIPIVVPRDPKFNEHVDNHQILFTKRLEENNKVIGIYNIKDLSHKISNYNDISIKYSFDNSNSNTFVRKFDRLISNQINIRR